jgi:tetratricopeptide (TPR) repeat protein
MDRRFVVRWWRWVAFVVASLLGLGLAAPYLVGAYHLEAGGRVMDAPEFSTDDPLPALAHLQKAIRWESGNAQAYRLLGKVYQAQGDWPAAIEALARYTALRPDNPLGHVELAGVYEAVEAEMQAMRLADLVADLPQATVGAPEVAVDTPFARPDGPTWHSYVATTTLSLPPGFGERPTLFMHSPAWVTCTLTLPVRPAVFRFGMGLDPQVLDWPGDGATFEVFVNGERIFLEHVDKAMARQGWHERAIDLTPWAGQVTRLTLAVTPGPRADASGDWAGWGEPQVVDARLPALEALQPGARVVEEWRRAGLSAEEFIRRGEEARKVRLYDEALVWYGRAARLAPDVGDPWYDVGLLYEEQQQWQQALAAYERASALGRFRQVGSSGPHYRAGVIYRWQLAPGRPEKAVTAFEAALAADDFDTVVEAAHCHYLYGYVLREQKAEAERYIAEFRQAIALDPGHAWAHVFLGVALYERDGDARAAEAEFLRALELSPQNKWACYHLGEVYRLGGRADEARAMYQKALEIDPVFEAAQRRLQALSDGE